MSDGRILTGELVVTGANRFRLVGHDGFFVAPAGIPVSDFDGKPVQAEFSRDGKVVRISEVPIQIQPISHGLEVISGEMVVADAVRRTFTLAGDSRLFVAPPTMDIRPFAGRRVELRLDEDGRMTAIELAGGPSGSLPLPIASSCTYEGQGYSNGASMCQSGTRFRCETGAWRNLGSACPALAATTCELSGMTYDEGASRCSAGTRFVCTQGSWRNLGTSCSVDGATASELPRTCMIGDATVASGSSICRGGATYRCSEGGWVNVGAPCS